MRDVKEFHIKYSGKSLENNEIDVCELGNALLAIGELLTVANTLINKNEKISVRVKANEKGSFDVSLIAELLEKAKNALLSDGITAINNLYSLLFCVSAPGIMYLIKITKGKKPSKITKTNDENVKIIINDKEYIISKSEFLLFENIAVRKSLYRILSPLKQEGISKVTICDENEDITIHKGEEEYFYVQDEQEELSDQIITGAYTIVSLAFRKDNKWRLSDGENTYQVTVKDEDLLERLDSESVSFFKRDILICEMRRRQYKVESGIKTEYELIKVLEHKKSNKQENLF